MVNKFIRCLPALMLALALPLAAQSADMDGAVSKQTGIASAHAGMALGATDLKTAHTHMQHVVNCLVGPAGKGFDAQAEDPCKDMGQGAIVDAKGDAATESTLHTALKEARQGLKTTTLDGAHADAQKLVATLQTK